jgi:hypothetical protein
MTSRRTVLAAGVGITFSLAGLGRALAADRIARGVRTVSGDVSVNGQPATLGMPVRPGDSVIAGPNGEVVFVVGRDAFLVRADTSVDLEARARSPLLAGLRIATGRILSVFASGQPKRIETPTATVGIRGTAVYVEAEPGRSYVCTCYGTVSIASRDDPSARETVRTRHHDQPRYVMASGAPQMLMGAPVVNHTDAELVLLEGLVGRRPPFGTARPYRY